MWKLALGAVLALPLTVGTANAATVDVSITKTASAPSNASLSTPDTVRFTNNDTTAHQVAFKTHDRRDMLAESVRAAAGAERDMLDQLSGNVRLSDPPCLPSRDP